MINSAQPYPVHTLLSDRDKLQYRVPRYQREYSWQKSQWEDLFGDLVESEGGHFLGTIITLSTTTDSTRGAQLEVIDGQQRLTTITILLAAIHSVLAASDEPSNELLVDRMTLVRRLMIESEPRFVPQVQNHNLDDFRAVLHKAGVGPRVELPMRFGNRRIARCFEHFRGALADLADSRGIDANEAAQQVLESVLSAIIVKIEVASTADAFILFESLNNRGMPLTPVDLIKNHILAESERRNVSSVEDAFEAWTLILRNLGGEYANHERFLRHFYNAFKRELPVVDGAPVATKARLMRIFETLLSADFHGVLARLETTSAIYGRITGERTLERDSDLDRALQRLSRVQGVPSYVLVLWLLSESGYEDADISEIVELLGNFFVRRNLSGTPQTYALPALFMSLIDDLSSGDKEPLSIVRDRLAAVSVDDGKFRELLDGPIYLVNVEVARFILTSIEERSMTAESRRDLWERQKNQFAWTIEHVFPQGANLPVAWVMMMGGASAAAAAQDRDAHRLGNLTITRYNSTLGNKSFMEKRDRTDTNQNFIGYRNGLSLNRELATMDAWTLRDIEERTNKLADQALSMFPLFD